MNVDENSLKILRNVDFLRDLDETLIRNLIEACDLVSLEKDEILFSEGSVGNEMYLVLSGEVLVYKTNKIIAFRGEGQYFGEMALIDNKPRSASVKAVRQTRLCKVPREQFQSQFASNPGILQSLLKTLSERSRTDLDSLDEDNLKLHTQERWAHRLQHVLNDTFNEIYLFENRDHKKFLQVNHRVHQNLGYTPEEISDLSPLEIIQGLTPRRFNEYLETLLCGLEEAVIFEGYHLRKNGTQYPVEIRMQIVETGKFCIFALIAQDNTRRKLAERALKDSREELRELAHRLQTVRENEKARIAREVHDELGQALTVVKMKLLNLEETLPDSPKIYKDTTRNIDHSISDIIESIHRLCTELRPSILDIFGIAEAIEWHAKEFFQHTSIHYKISLSKKAIKLDPEGSIAMFRIFQEICNNIVKHSEATEVLIRFFENKGVLSLIVEDNGIGFDEDKLRKSVAYGLIGIRERVHYLKGELSIEGGSEKGTRIQIDVPLES